MRCRPLKPQRPPWGTRLRAHYRLKTPDSIVLATTIHAGATGFIGNDVQMARVPAIDVLLLDR